jgi:3-polyprenyl-4-hydroxybenzoate decarboxylase
MAVSMSLIFQVYGSISSNEYDWERDLFVFANVSQDTLDYTGPSVNKGSKAMMLGLGQEKCRELPREFPGFPA